MKIRPLDIGFREDVDRRARSILILALVLSVIGALLNHLPAATSMRMWIITPISPAVEVVDSVRAALYRMISPEKEHSMKQPHLSLSDLFQQDRINALQKELAELKGISGIKQELSYDGIIASVTGRAIGTDRRVLFIDAGIKDGIKKGAIVLANVDNKIAVVGKVIETSYDISKVQTIFDPFIKIPARMNEKDGYVYTGSMGNRDGRLDYVPKEDNVKSGDEIFTSDNGRIFPGGYLIGRVKSIGDGRTIFQDVRVQPAVSEDLIQYVWIAKGKVK